MKPIPQNLESFQGFVEVVAALRAPNGCPWDREQTHTSLRHNLLEECYEVLEALDKKQPSLLAEELGDVLVQVAFHTQIAQEAGEFTWSEVLQGASEKLVRRHPHVFGDVEVKDARQVEENWEVIKKAEKGEGSLLDGVPRETPALAYCQAISHRAARAGFEWDDLQGVMDKVNEELLELKEAPSQEERELELGDLLFSLVNMARWMDLDAESALRKASAKFYSRFNHMERLCRERRMDFKGLTLFQKEALWQEAKAATKS